MPKDCLASLKKSQCCTIHWRNILLSTVVSIGTFVWAIRTAQNKLFWNDEGYDIFALHSLSFSSVFLGNTAQPNNNPLYSVLQKTVISLISFNDDAILVYCRLVSIIAASLLVFVLCYFASRWFGRFWAVLSVLAVINQPLFFQYAAESRHYMLWLFCFLGLSLSTASLCSRNYNAIPRTDKFLYILACLANTLVISMGVIQVAAAIAGCVLCWWFVHPSSNKDRINFLIRFAVPLLVLCVGLELFYGLKKSAVLGSFSGSRWDILQCIQTGDYSLLQRPLRLLIPKIHHEKYLGYALFNVFFWIGLVMPIFLWKKRKALSGAVLAAFVLSVVMFLQVLATVAIGAVIAFYHFYFVERVFLYLLICHSLIALAGGVFGYQLLRQRTGRGPVSKTLKLVVVLLLVLLSIHPLGFSKALSNKQSEVGCLDINGKLSADRQSFSNIESIHYQRLNFVVDVSRRLKACAASGRGGARDVYAWQNSSLEWFLVEKLPFEGEPFWLFGDNAVAKLRFSEADPNGAMILEKLINSGVLKEVGSTAVRLKRNADGSATRPGEIEGSGFDAIWGTLQQAQEIVRFRR